VIGLDADRRHISQRCGWHRPEPSRLYNLLFVTRRSKTLDLKPPILISRISPDSAPVGTTVTVYGSGFTVPGFTTALVFNDFPNKPMPPPAIAADGKSLTFKISFGNSRTFSPMWQQQNGGVTARSLGPSVSAKPSVGLR
jgi:hypothetical protein